MIPVARVSITFATLPLMVRLAHYYKYCLSYILSHYILRMWYDSVFC